MENEKIIQIAGITMAVVIVGLLILFYRNTMQSFTALKGQNDGAVRMEQPFDLSVFDDTILTKTTVKSLLDYGWSSIPIDFDICDIEDDDKDALYVSELVKNANGVTFLVRITHKEINPG